MKTHKKLILVAATVLVVGGAGTGVALAMQDEPKKVATEQSASVEPQYEPVEAVVEQQTVTEPVQEEQPPVEPQETLQEEAERRTREHAAKFGLDADKQWMCMDKVITGDTIGGYENEGSVREFINTRLQERLNDQGGYLVTYFDGVCPTRTKTVHLD